MKRRPWIMMALLVACGGPAKGGHRGAEDRIDLSASPDPIARAEIARAVVPDHLAHARQVIAGSWAGRRYDYWADGGFSGDAGDRSRVVFTLSADGTYLMAEEECEHTGRYTLDWDDPAEVGATNTDLILSLHRERSCGSDAAYRYQSRVHRLDDDVLVLIDGSTGGVTAFRRGR